MKITAGFCAIALVAWCASLAAAAPFTFGTFTFEQDFTPDTLALLGNGQNLGGAQFSAGAPTKFTRSVGFGSTSGNENSGFVPAANWRPNVSLGQLAAGLGLTQSDGTASKFSSAVNLPSSDNGSTQRHGLSLSWSSGMGLINGTGNDFVVYESGSLGSPEGFMVRVELDDGSFSDWYYSQFDTFQAYTRTPFDANTGAFATAFDLSDLGIADGALVLSIQIANLIAADRIPALSGGFVNFAGVGVSPGFGSDFLDPDPLYVGILGQLGPLAAEVPEPASLAIWGLVSMAGAAFGWRKRRLANK